ncbi:hypothetical protein D9Q98_003844 [Chlorella vulgaris]|uniref:Zinc finger Sec23/Sec24-type domain-containing protein n=1 Tax=Chlorella vulgaris TaxID=3077 RepID=A0A9D4TQX0_CHLVU|nr:hypothetical protein D9Q98_003844 [Chlorella vulgaris]
MLQFTCPCPTSAELQTACGLPLGLVAQPLASVDGSARVAPASCWAAALARCARCQAYINPLCEVDDRGWGCALCGCANDFSSAASMRRYYAAGSQRRSALPELTQAALDAACPLVAADPDEGTDEVEAVEAAPAVLALVDAGWEGEEGEGGLEAVRSALAAALEALPACGRFGLVSFGSKVTLHPVTADSNSDTAATSGTPEAPPPPVQLAVGTEAEGADLSSAAPLGSVLAPVGTCKAALLAAIDGLQAEGPDAGGGGGGRQRALGDTLRAVLRWVATGAAAAAADDGGAADAAHRLHQRQQHQRQQKEKEQKVAQQAPQQQHATAAGDAGGEAAASWRTNAAAEEGEEEAHRTEERQWQDTRGLQRAQGFPGLRLLLFLSGPPNSGLGAVVALRPSPPDPAAVDREAAAAAEEAQKDFGGMMLDPAYPELSAWGDAAAASVQRRAAAAAAAAAAAESAATAAGDLSHAAPPGVAGGELTVNPAAREFYAEAGAAAAALGIIVDVFAACPRWIGLDLLAPLATASGGGVLLYSSLDTAPLPQDVYKCVTQPRAFACLLRLRASPELDIGGHYGRLTADREPGLYRAVACTPGDAFAFELDRNERQDSGAPPAVQLVLQYSMLLPAAAAGQEQAGGGGRYVLRRRMRILTAALPLADTPQQLYAGCDAEATACLVVHKVMEGAASAGTSGARQMLLDWLVLLAARVADPEAALYERPRLRKGEVPPPPAKVDPSLSQYEALQQLPHFVYSLLCGPLLRPAQPAALPAAAAAPGQQQQRWQAHPEAAAAMRLLLAVLPPDEAAVVVCPQLSSWSSPDSVALWRHSLSAAALAVEQQPIWVLDTFTHLICLYAAGTASGVVGGAPPPPFPPPADSLLRRTLAGIRQVRRSTPELLLLRQGLDDSSIFFDSLLEDGGGGGGGGSGQVPTQLQGQPQHSFVSFLEAVEQQAQAVLLAEQ